MNVPFVDLKAQYKTIESEINPVILEVIGKSAFVGGSYVREFEDSFAKFVGVSYCVGVGNGTDALHTALRAIGVGPGDEVITVANSFIATSEAISLTGARVVFVDCHKENYNIDLELIETAITEKTKAIVPVHLYGLPADMHRVMDIAEKYGLWVVEDAAQAHGAKIGDRCVGSFGHLGCFSFYPGKNLGAYGDAGAVVTNDQGLAEKVRMIANHGSVTKYEHQIEGLNSRLDGIQAAVLQVKLKYIDTWNQRRRENANRYNYFLRNSGVVLPPNGIEEYQHIFHLYVVRVKNRAAVMEKLGNQGISTGIHYPHALPNLNAYGYLGYKPSDFPVASQYAEEILSLPMFPELTETQIVHVCNQLMEITD